MKLIPDAGLLFEPPPRLGDTILLEPILRTYLSKGFLVDARTPYRQVFKNQNWPTIEDGSGPVVVDLTGPWSDANRVQQYQQELTELGYTLPLISDYPRIDNIVADIHKGDGLKIGLAHRSMEEYKQWPRRNWRLLARHLLKRHTVFAFDKFVALKVGNDRVGLGFQELMRAVVGLDLFISNDTGLAHLAAALGIQTVVLMGETDCDKIYMPHGERVEIVHAPKGNLRALSVAHVLKTAMSFGHSVYADLMTVGNVNRRLTAKSKGDTIGLMRMDGLGGTLTLLDQAQKVWSLTGQKVELITRGFESLLLTHPAVGSVRNLSSMDWFDALSVIRSSYKALADVRLAVGKWYGAAPFDGSDEYDDYYHDFPKGISDLDGIGKNQILVADSTLGLPDQDIEMTVYTDDPSVASQMPDDYILIAVGCDSIHHGRKNMKLWPRLSWEKAVAGLPNVVQVGSMADERVDGTLSLLGKTSHAELAGLVRRAHLIICLEGGICHLAFACDHPRTVVLRGPTQGALLTYPGVSYVNGYACEPCWSQDDDWMWKCMKGVDAVCMRTITPERVRCHIESYL